LHFDISLAIFLWSRLFVDRDIMNMMIPFLLDSLKEPSKKETQKSRCSFNPHGNTVFAAHMESDCPIFFDGGCVPHAADT